MRAIAVGMLLLGTFSAAARGPTPPKLTPEQQKLVAEAGRFDAGAMKHYAAGRPLDAVREFERALAVRKQLYPAATHPLGHVDLAETISNLGAMYLAARQPDAAIPLCRDAVAMMERLHPPAEFPNGTSDLAQTLANLGSGLDQVAAFEEARRVLDRSLAMRRKLFPPEKFPAGLGDLANSLNNLGSLLQRMGERDAAIVHLEEAVALRQRLYPADRFPNGRPELAINLTNLGRAYDAVGRHAKALEYYRRALAMKQKLYPPADHPDGHLEIAHSLGSIALALLDLKNQEQARSFSEQSLAMYRKLAARAGAAATHPDVALALHNLALVHLTGKDYAAALAHQREAIDQWQRLYKSGHPYLARGWNNLGAIQVKLGQFDAAAESAERSLAMKRQFYPRDRYPDGHDDLVTACRFAAIARARAGQPAEARAYAAESIAMHQRVTSRLLQTAAESDALGSILGHRHVIDYFLSFDPLPDAAAVDTYRHVWTTKAALTRVLERRHAAARAAGAGQADDLKRLGDLRRQIDRVQRAAGMPADERDRRLAALADDRDRLERRLSRQLPVLDQWKMRDAMGVDDLVKALPADAAFVDLVAYVRRPIARDARIPATPHYVAFVVAPSQPVRRIELGPAAPIDAAVAAWRTAIDRRQESPAAADLCRLVWTPLAAHVPAAARTLFVSADDDLARLPWAALPTADGRVLLEDFAVALVPHGPFLLERLAFPVRYTGPDRVLAAGGLDYGASPWPALPGTVREVAALAALAGRPPVRLGASAATSARLADELPKARYAHLATHGYFDEAASRAQRERAQAAVREWQFTADRGYHVPAGNPLGFTGLVLSNGEVFTGGPLVDLPLENLKLVTLSACETGLGESTGGEGVQGLQRAFHLAGCPNVVASLWKVNDAATAALMAKFYHELWVNKQEPLAALREAQLTIYRRPDLIPDLAGERGAPKLKDAVAVKSVDPPPAKPQAAGKADTKLWAAFVLSGTGR